jgi:hypothetical protein
MAVAAAIPDAALEIIATCLSQTARSEIIKRLHCCGRLLAISAIAEWPVIGITGKQVVSDLGSKRQVTRGFIAQAERNTVKCASRYGYREQRKTLRITEVFRPGGKSQVRRRRPGVRRQLRHRSTNGYPGQTSHSMNAVA